MRLLLAALLFAAAPSLASVTTQGNTTTLSAQATAQSGIDLRESLLEGKPGTTILCTDELIDFDICTQPDLDTIITLSDNEWRDIRFKRLMVDFVRNHLHATAIGDAGDVVDALPDPIIGDP